MVLRMPGPLAFAGDAASKPAALWTGAAPAKALQTAPSMFNNITGKQVMDLPPSTDSTAWCLAPVTRWPAQADAAA